MIQKTESRAYFRKAKHAYGMKKKVHILENLGQFEDELFPLNSNQIQSFRAVKMPRK